MAKRANNEGSVYRDGDRWVAALVTGHRPDGKPIRRRFTAKTQTAVKAKLKAAKDALAQGLDIPDPNATVAELAAWWQAEVLPHEGLAPKTLAWYQQMTRLVLPYVGHKRLSGPQALTPSDITAIYPKLKTPRTREAARTVMSKMLRAAEVEGRVGRNVARLAPSPKSEGKARVVKAHTTAEIKMLLAGLTGSRWHPIVLVGATTGLRPQELLALHWADIHLDDEPYLSVRWAFQYRPSLALKAPKRERSYRTVPLAPEAAAALKARRRDQAAERLAAGPLWSPDWPGLVFTRVDGGPYRSLETMRLTMLSALAGSYPYRLRHTYATHLLERGVPIHHVAELLGDSVAIVESTYSHVLRTKHEAATVASSLLG